MTGVDRPLPADAVRRLTADPGPWLSCDDCFRLVDRYVEGLLTGGARPMRGELGAMPGHLSGCPACSEEATTLLLLAAAEAGIDPAPALQRLLPD
ncbi:hypothetical protein [Geodermatophilus sabuli]|uniref:Zf-HC2 domain-containing protein n=1 Tax=Geodermatophilus sabuli TaxID=1564158 RepID=A0A285EB45_9ACTN|nr:hypothetical protein [Geodermatophilus sabuli]MBB3084403.1 hypothetical protein [Geodermatophilus sabuli]SNX96329.1 hypothetical protein SAMN06893097_10443 [Geodermatophilus sabuli]